MSESDDARDRRINRNLRRQIDRARHFPYNTTPASRHVEQIADALARSERYAMIDEDPAYVAGGLLAVLAGYYQAKNEIARLREKYEGITPKWKATPND